MDCTQVRTLAQRFIENALPAAETAAVEAHLNHCDACQEAMDGLLGEPVLKPYAPYYRAPAPLKDRIARAVGAPPEASAQAPTRPRRAWKLPEWLKLGMVSFTTAVVMAVILLPLRMDVADGATADALIASHVRWNRLDKLVDVPTSDRHTVKPWLSQKLGFSPLVPELGSAGFALIGGRIDYVQDRFVGTVVYKRREHVIDVYAWPGGRGGERAEAISHNGYHVVKWRQDDITYWAVSDLNMEELRHFAELYARAS